MGKSVKFGPGHSISGGSNSKQTHGYGSGHVPYGSTHNVLKRRQQIQSSTAGVAKSSNCLQFGNHACYGRKSSPGIKSSSSILKLVLNKSNIDACNKDKKFPFVWGGFRISKC